MSVCVRSFFLETKIRCQSHGSKNRGESTSVRGRVRCLHITDKCIVAAAATIV